MSPAAPRQPLTPTYPPPLTTPDPPHGQNRRPDAPLPGTSEPLGVPRGPSEPPAPPPLALTAALGPLRLAPLHRYDAPSAAHRPFSAPRPPSARRRARSDSAHPPARSAAPAPLCSRPPRRAQKRQTKARDPPRPAPIGRARRHVPPAAGKGGGGKEGEAGGLAPRSPPPAACREL